MGGLDPRLAPNIVVEFGWGSEKLLPDFAEPIELVHPLFVILQKAPTEAGSGHHACFVEVFGVKSSSRRSWRWSTCLATAGCMLPRRPRVTTRLRQLLGCLVGCLWSGCKPRRRWQYRMPRLLVMCGQDFSSTCSLPNSGGAEAVS